MSAPTSTMNVIGDAGGASGNQPSSLRPSLQPRNRRFMQSSRATAYSQVAGRLEVAQSKFNCARLVPISIKKRLYILPFIRHGTSTDQHGHISVPVHSCHIPIPPPNILYLGNICAIAAAPRPRHVRQRKLHVPLGEARETKTSFPLQGCCLQTNT